MTDPLRYGRLRVQDGPLEEFHHALNALKANTCERGRCDPHGRCTKHRLRVERRHLQAVGEVTAVTA